LGHPRDVAVVPIKNVFAQVKSKWQTIALSVSQIEDESFLQDSRAFCADLLRDPQGVIAAAPAPPEGVVSAVVGKGGKRPSDEFAELMAENARLKGEIVAGLRAFPQSGKTVEILRQRDIERAGLKATL
jgi:hypothetical protein